MELKMNPLFLANALLEADDLGFDPEEYVKAGGAEVADEVYNDDVVRIIQPKNIHTLNDYLRVKRDENSFQSMMRYDDPVFIVIPKLEAPAPATPGAPVEEYQPVVLLPTRPVFHDEFWHKHELADLPKFIGPEATEATTNALTKLFVSQARKRGDTKATRAAIRNLILLGRYDDAAKHGKYHLGKIENVPMGHSLELMKAIRKQGRRPSGRISRMMKGQENILWKDKGFYLLFDDWEDTIKYALDTDRNRFDVESTAKGALSGEMDWLSIDYIDPKDCWDHIDKENAQTIARKAIGRTYTDDSGDERVIDEATVNELDLEEIIFSDENGSEFEDIQDAIRWAGQDAERSGIEGAYSKAYMELITDALGQYEWITTDGYDWKNKKNIKVERLGFFVPYERLDEWLAKEREAEGEYFDPETIDIWKLVETYVDKSSPNEDYSHDFDEDYFNESLGNHLYDIKDIETVPVPAEPADPAQPEMPLDDPRMEERPVQPIGMVRVGIYNGNRQMVREIKLPAAEANEYVAANPNAEILGPVED
jgi:hypothetical protein